MSSTLAQNTSLVPASSLSGSSGIKPPVEVANEAANPPNRSKVPTSPWKWLAVTCAILSVSGGIRFWRDMQFRNLAKESATCPFKLDEFAKDLGTWHAEDGMDAQLDPETARIAGASEHVIRVYKDSKTGETASVLLLYGAADSVFAHSPDVCYPASGYRPFGGRPVDRPLTTATSPAPAVFRTSYFTKTTSGLNQYWEVFCTFRHNGQWLNDLASRWKMFRAYPAMFKIQIQRQTSGLMTEDSPTESLLRGLIEEVDRQWPQNKPVTVANTK
jgi:Protein of unknown function (DUF3485)